MFCDLVIALTTPGAHGLTDPVNASIGWEPHHGWDDRTERVDGRLVDLVRGESISELDIVALTDQDLPVEAPAAARSAWDRGAVHAYLEAETGVTVLCIPDPHLSTKSITAALARFRP